ncbi:PEP-CTERM sorting domain-containing protein [Massilia forsythiae]|uniref:PEP-CTERM sorting domain-containing protein n=1 Tax=Massilia forsythiae TaxID=2728020 RepID=A0A7Z2VUP3_9BURK|nr:choice-of-anchor J domain-containing protein [Massilia forsythiae]QJD99462.1 PEP-CTERM sorting domain-containing protein [Massilia forsythiae]
MSAQAGVVINEGFENVAALASQGWSFTNASAPGGTTSGWFQGSDGPFTAQSGSNYSYAQANFNNTTSGGSIDSWLITPEFNATYGVDISFYLRAGGEGYTDTVSYGFTGTNTALTTITPVPDSAWTLYTVHLDAYQAGTTRFAFRYTGTYDTANAVALDSLTVDVPEPASIALMAGGLLGLGALRRRSRA